MPHGITMGESLYAAEYLEYFAGWADKIHGEVDPGHRARRLRLHPARSRSGWSRRSSRGTRRSSPVGLQARAGARRRQRRRPQAERSSPPSGRCAWPSWSPKAGFPRGVVNVVTGDGSTGRALVEHPGVDRIAFTGGTETGRKIAAIAGRNLKPRRRWSSAASPRTSSSPTPTWTRRRVAATTAIFLNGGQACMAGSRLLVEAYDRRRVRGEGRRGGGARWWSAIPFQPGTLMGPLISERHLERVLGMVDEARSSADGGRPAASASAASLPRGTSSPPRSSPACRTTSGSRARRSSGPVLSVIPFTDQAEAIAIANDTAVRPGRRACGRTT